MTTIIKYRQRQFTAGYVYLLLCQIEGAIHVKCGRSVDPIERLHGLVIGSPVQPELMAIAALPTRIAMLRAEKRMHVALAPWHLHGEWFKFSSEDRAAFNAAWHQALDPFSTPMWRITWTKFCLRELFAQRAQSRRFHHTIDPRNQRELRVFRGG